MARKFAVALAQYLMVAAGIVAVVLLGAWLVWLMFVLWILLVLMRPIMIVAGVALLTIGGFLWIGRKLKS